MKYLYVNLSGLRGRYHPCLANIVTTEDVKKMRPYLKFMTGDYLTNQGNPLCRLCHMEGETICHILAICPIYEVKRTKMLREITELCTKESITFDIQDILGEDSPEVLTQFILDPTSFNLKKRVNISDPIAQQLFKISREMCYYIHSERMRQLGELSKRKT